MSVLENATRTRVRSIDIATLRCKIDRILTCDIVYCDVINILIS